MTSSIAEAARRRRSAAVLLAATVLALAGCAATPAAYTGCMPWHQQQEHPALAVSFLSPELADMVGVRQVGTARTGSGLSAVHAAFHNCTDTDVVLLVRTRFGNAVQPGPAELRNALLALPFVR